MTVIKKSKKIIMATISLILIIFAGNANVTFAAAVDPITINYNIKKEKLEVSDGYILDRRLPWEIGETAIYIKTIYGTARLSEKISRDFFILFNLQNEGNIVKEQKIFCSTKLLNWIKANIMSESVKKSFNRTFQLQIVGNLCCKQEKVLYTMKDQCFVNVFVEGPNE